MNYEQFLFTRNKRRDFTAFVRPVGMTNKEVSLLASAFNFITDVAALTSEQPGLYCFPLGEYIYVLRHHDSGRTHAGREIGVIEGIAVHADDSTALAALLPEIFDRQAERLDVTASIVDIEDAEVRKSDMLSLAADSPEDASDGELEIPVELLDPDEETDPPSDDDYLLDADARLADEQLVLPFSDDGRAVLIEALRRMPSKPLHFAFGTNADVIGRLAEAGIDFDVVGLFGATEPTFRARAVKKPVALPPLVKPEPIAPPMSEAPQHHSLLGRLFGWLLGR